MFNFRKWLVERALHLPAKLNSVQDVLSTPAVKAAIKKAEIDLETQAATALLDRLSKITGRG